MTDAHCHIRSAAGIRELVCGERFLGIHPWEVAGLDAAACEARLAEIRRRLAEDPSLGVGEIGLDRLKDRNISPLMREVFEKQLALAFEFARPVVLHGAKCWGQVAEKVKSVKCKAKSEREVKNVKCKMDNVKWEAEGENPDNSNNANNQNFLFHGFSRSAGLIPEIAGMGGFISVGPAVLNDHAVNYRELVKRIPSACLMLETDRTAENAAECPAIAEIAAEVAKLREISVEELEALTDANVDRFLSPHPNSYPLTPTP